MVKASSKRSRQNKRAGNSGPVDDKKPITRGAPGGKLKVLTETQVLEIHKASIYILTEVGFSEHSKAVEQEILQAGGSLNSHGRLVFSLECIESALIGLNRNVVLYGQDKAHDLNLSGTNVHFGTGGAYPEMVDFEAGNYRDSTLLDIYNTARLVDKLEHVHFFSRPFFARDIENTKVADVNTAFACLSGTSKHVIVSSFFPEHVREIFDMCCLIAGSKERFLKRPFLSVHINHIVPPLRFYDESTDVLAECVRLGIPVHLNIFGQLGASSPVTMAGCLAQTNAEVLAGMVLAWLINPKVKAVYGARPMITDLRSGGMAGGSGEQALLTAASVQIANFYRFSNSTISGATDSKTEDTQSGYEKAINISNSAQAGSNLITQAAGSLASLMAGSFESYVIDNDMLGSIGRTISDIEVNKDTLSLKLISETVIGEGHYLGASDTLERMKKDFLYPELSDRSNPQVWESLDRPSIREKAKKTVKKILNEHYPSHLKPALLRELRERFDIRIDSGDMQKK
jgi:trimethylamine--corrinoid protein Co-methyltransferase